MAEHDREGLLKKVRRGYWIACVGLALQLVGVVWNALPHHFGPDQATKESVFGFTNPSYLLIVLGMGLTVAGAAWWMFFVPRSRRSGFRLFGLPVLAAAILVALSLLTSGIAIATGGLSVRQEQQSEDATFLAMGAMGDVGHRIAADDPMLIELKDILISDGTTAALDRTEELAAKDEGFSGSHQYAHELGRFSYAYRGGDVVEAFRLCDGRFHGGCYHGALEAYFEDDPDFEADDLPGFCEGGMIDARATGTVKSNCLHGLGHGLSLFFDHDLQEPLRYCDFLRTDRDRNSCYNGVFMEYMVFSQDRRDQQGRAGQGGTLEDPHYPCNSVEDRYKRECYAYQPIAILLQNGRDFEETFEACDEAPKPYVAACYQGMGNATHILHPSTLTSMP